MVLNPVNNIELNNATNSINTSIGETYQIIYFLDIFNQINIRYKQFFKISGRYLINNEFIYNKYISDKIIFKYNKITTRYIINKICLLCKQNIEYITAFYKISEKRFKIYKNGYKRIYKNIKNKKLEHWIIEVTLATVIDKKYIRIEENLGITSRYTNGGIDKG